MPGDHPYITSAWFWLFFRNTTYISINSTVNQQKLSFFWSHPPTSLLTWYFSTLNEHLFQSWRFSNQKIENCHEEWGVSQPKKLSYNFWNKEKLQRLRESRTIFAIKLHTYVLTPFFVWASSNLSQFFFIEELRPGIDFGDRDLAYHVIGLNT